MRKGFALFKHRARAAVTALASGLAVLAGSAALPSASAQAASLSFNGTILQGVNGITIGTDPTVYDVRFGDDSISSSDYLFTTTLGVHNAGQALKDALQAAYPAGVKDPLISQFQGCAVNAVSCKAAMYSTVVVPQAPTTYTGSLVGMNHNSGGYPSFGLSFNAFDPHQNLAAVSEETWAHWSVAPVAAVPEPETYAMLLSGLGLVGAMVRRRRVGH